MKIISKEKSHLIDRTKIVAEFPHISKPTPSNAEIKKAISHELNVDEKLVVIKQIGTQFGEGNSIIKAYVYDNLEELKKLEKHETPKKEQKPVKEEPKGEVK